jgi:hypothetical protein
MRPLIAFGGCRRRRSSTGSGLLLGAMTVKNAHTIDQVVGEHLEHQTSVTAIATPSKLLWTKLASMGSTSRVVPAQAELLPAIG